MKWKKFRSELGFCLWVTGATGLVVLGATYLFQGAFTLLGLIIAVVAAGLTFVNLFVRAIKDGVPKDDPGDNQPG